MLDAVDFPIQLDETHPLSSGPNELGCRAVESESKDGVLLLVHQLGSAGEAQTFADSYLSDPPETADVLLLPRWAKAVNGDIVVVLQSGSADLDTDQLLALVEQIASATDESTLGFDTDTPTIPPPTTAPERTRSPLSLVIESQSDGETCYRIESDKGIVVPSGCFTGSLARDGAPPIHPVLSQSYDGREVLLYAVDQPFEVTSVVIEPQDVQWSDTPPQWLLITIPLDAGAPRIEMKSPDGSLVCLPTLMRTTCEQT